MSNHWVSHHDVIVGGAGIVGATVALGLAKAGLHVAVVEASMPKPFLHADDRRVYAISPASAAVFSRMGIWHTLCQHQISAYSSMCVWERGDDEVSFDAALVGESALGWIVEDSLLRWILWEAINNHPQITMLAPNQVIGYEIDPDSAAVRLDDGKMLRAELIIAADGGASALRELVGISMDTHHYGERAVVAHVTTQKKHDQTAWQRFTPDGSLAFLPLADGRSSIVWSLKDARATEIMACDDKKFMHELALHFGWRLGNIEQTSSRLAFPLRYALADTFVGPRMALIGDAAHVVHPLAGQGLNLGILDAAALIETLDYARQLREDLGSDNILMRYNQWRRSDCGVMAKSFDLLDGIFRTNVPGVAQIRRLGLKTVGQSTPLKRRFALAACGMAGRVPKLALRIA